LVDVVISALNNNPRKIKKFHSLYQLQVVLANDQSILYDPNSPEIYKKEQVTSGQIAKYVAISIEWPLFTSNVRYDTHIIQEIEQYEMGDADWGTMSAEAKYWYRDSELVRLLLYKVDEEKEELQDTN